MAQEPEKASERGSGVIPVFPARRSVRCAGESVPGVSRVSGAAYSVPTNLRKPVTASTPQASHQSTNSAASTRRLATSQL